MKRRTLTRPQSIEYTRRYEAFRHGFSAETLDAIRAYADLAAGSRVLDLATGTGILLHAWLRVTPHVCGLDLSPTMLAEARRKRPHAPLVRARGEGLPFADQTFDLVSIGQAIHWFDLDVLLPEVRRVLRPGGALAVLSRYPSPADPLRARVAQVRHAVQSAGAPPHAELTSDSSNIQAILGLESLGYGDARRQVFAHEESAALEVYLDGLLQSGDTGQPGGTREEEYRRRLEDVLREMYPDGVVREMFLDYLILARRV